MLSDGLCFNFSSANMNYCEFVATLPDNTDNPNKHYHDTQYGFPIEDDNELFERLLADAGIVRNRLKINAAIYNARQIKQIQQEYGSFKNWLDTHHPLDKAEWVKLFKKHFKFVGGEIVGEFLMSTGYLPGVHVETCPVYREILACRPKWAEAV